MDRVKVLVVDDSALIREVVSRVLNGDPQLEVVATAADPYEARDLIKKYNPDVLTLDVEMPKMDGITFLRNLMRLRPMPVVMLSTLTAAGTDATLQALELGAIDFVQKPNGPSSSQGMLDETFIEMLCEKVKVAATVRGKLLASRIRTPALSDIDMSVQLPQPIDRVIAIGSSTGGVEAIQMLLEQLPEKLPPIVITQHIPAQFSQRLAIRLNKYTRLTIVEAENGAVLKPGHVYLAPGGKHLSIQRLGYLLQCRIDDTPAVNRHKPSVEVMFNSLIEAKVIDPIVVMLTGMGSDGAEAMLRLKEYGAYTIAQDEATSMVWGMPGSAVQLGAALEQLPLEKIASGIVRHLNTPRTARKSESL